jgi:hypothetical protein
MTTAGQLSLTAAAVSLLVQVGCADILDVAEDPQLVETGPWRCVKQPVAAKAPTKDRAVVRVRTCNFVSTNCSEPVTGLTASLCNKRDVNCEDPITTNLTDNAGEFSFSVPTGGPLGTGFDGFLQISSSTALCSDESVFGPTGPKELCKLAPGCDPNKPDEHCRLPAITPSLLFFNPPVRADFAQPQLVPLVPTAAVVTIPQAVGGAVDPTLGNVFITARDCDNSPAAGVRFAMTTHNDDHVTNLYLKDGVISNATMTTDVSGLGGMLGVPTGFSTVAGYTSLGETADTKFGETGVQVAPFTITYTTLTPAGSGH